MLETMSNGILKSESGHNIKFNSKYNNEKNNNGNNYFQKSNGYDYQSNLLSKKRKLEIDLKNGNMNNFNKVLKNAVLNSNRNNDSELIPYKIEFKLSHVLKGEKKISENGYSDNKINPKEKCEIKNFDKKKISNKDNNSDSDNTSQETKTSSNEEGKKMVVEINNTINSFVKKETATIQNLNNERNKSLSKGFIFEDSYVDSLLEWKKPCYVGSGLNNMGNTCFLNSVLQNLLYTPALINYFDFSEHLKKCNPKGVCLMCEFCKLNQVSKSSKNGALTPKNILNNLKLISKNIKIGRQEDAHEFLLYFLDGLEKSCKTFVNQIRNNFIVSNITDEDNLIQKLFGGKLASKVICLKCKNVSKKDINNSDSIHRSLINFTKPESLSGSNKFFCENCKMKNDSVKKFSFENFPRVLVIHLKRFDNFQRKIKKFIEYGADLDLTKFSEDKSEEYKYRLYGVLVHEGSTISWGHYYCYIKNSNDLWYCMNDSSVSQTSLKTVLNQTPYLLFYEKYQVKKITNKINQEKITSLPMNIKSIPNNNGNILNKTGSIEKIIILNNEENKINILKDIDKKNISINNNLNSSKNQNKNEISSIDSLIKKKNDVKNEVLLKNNPEIKSNKIESQKLEKEIFEKVNLSNGHSDHGSIDNLMMNILKKESEIFVDTNTDVKLEKKIEMSYKIHNNDHEKIRKSEKVEEKLNFEIIESIEKLDSELLNIEDTKESIQNLFIKKPFMSKRYKRLLSIYSRFGRFKKNYKENNFFMSDKNNDLSLNENKDKVKKVKKTKENNIKDNLIREKYMKEKNITNLLDENNNENNEEDDAPHKKRIFNTKINELYHGHFIERWEDDDDDENELNNLRKQADFVRNSDAFKKSKILRKCKYDLDYDAGKQKKVKIYEEKTTNRNHFQQKHTFLLRKYNRMNKYQKK